MRNITSYRIAPTRLIIQINMFIWFILLSDSSLFAQPLNTVNLNSSPASNNQTSEDKFITFFINGLTSAQDEVTIEEILTNNSGIARARVSFISKECGLVTLKNSNINKVFLAALLKKSGFTIHTYTERLIGVPESKQINNHENAEIQSQDSAGYSAKIGTSSAISSQQWLRQLQEMKKTAIERGSSTEKYDKAINDLEKQIGIK